MFTLERHSSVSMYHDSINVWVKVSSLSIHCRLTWSNHSQLLIRLQAFISFSCHQFCSSTAAASHNLTSGPFIWFCKLGNSSWLKLHRRRPRPTCPTTANPPIRNKNVTKPHTFTSSSPAVSILNQQLAIAHAQSRDLGRAIPRNRKARRDFPRPIKRRQHHSPYLKHLPWQFTNCSVLTKLGCCSRLFSHIRRPAGKIWYIRRLRRLYLVEYCDPTEQSYSLSQRTQRHCKTYYGVLTDINSVYTASPPKGLQPTVPHRKSWDAFHLNRELVFTRAMNFISATFFYSNSDRRPMAIWYYSRVCQEEHPD